MVESTALEMRRGGNSTVGSNPTLSAIEFFTFLNFVNKFKVTASVTYSRAY